MIGLYEISPGKLNRALPVLSCGTELSDAFSVLQQVSYADYDPVTEFIWVHEMARFRLNLARSTAAPKSKRVIGAQSLYYRLPENPFLGPFFDRYRIELNLEARRGEPLKHPTLFDRCSITDRTSIDSSTSTRYQVPGSGTSDQVPVQASAAAAPRLFHSPEKETQKPSENVEVITSMVTKDLLPYLAPNIDFGDLTELVKSRCTTLGIHFDGQTIRKAIESAQFRQQLKTQVRRMS
jgi:hypothetical protein